ncbi:MAG: hypothetical protein WC254_06695 [Candidatus Woesearchaeota archaeon]|jgi:hypothetical protein
MVNVDTYTYPHIRFLLESIQNHTPIYRVLRDNDLNGVREVMIPSHDLRRVILYPEHSKGSLYKDDLAATVRHLFSTDPVVRVLLQNTDVDHAATICLHTGTSDYRLPAVLPSLFPRLTDISELVVDSKRYLSPSGEWKTERGKPRGGLPTGSGLVLVTADIVASGASEKRAFVETFVKTLDPRLYEQILHECNFPLLRDGTYTADLDKKLPDKPAERRELMLIDGLYDADASALKKAAATIKTIVGDNTHLVQFVSSIVMIAHGTEIAGPIAAECVPLFKAFSPDFTIHLLYPEGAFDLATKISPLPVKVPGTDILVKHGSSLELMTEMLKHPESFNETCIVYYGSARAGRPTDYHPLDVLRAMFALGQAAEQGLTKERHLQQRMPSLIATPNKTYEDFHREAQNTFIATFETQGALDATIRLCHEAYQTFWTNQYAKENLKASMQRRIQGLVAAFNRPSVTYFAQQLSERTQFSVQLPLHGITDAGEIYRLNQILERKRPLPIHSGYIH